MPRVHTGELSLYYVESGAGEPVVFVPGLGTDHTVWGYQTRALSRSFHCIAVDPRDAGRSDQAADGYTIAEMARDVVGLLDALGIVAAHLVGWSMGSAISQEVALSRPERVRSLTLVATYHEGDPRATERHEALAYVRRTLGLEAFQRVTFPWSFSFRSYLRPGFIDEIRRRAMEYPYQQTQEAYERQVQATLAHETRGRLGGITAPTLILVGEEDILTPPQRFAEAVAGEIPGSSLVVLPRMAHSLLAEAPEAVTEVLEAFLKTHPGTI